MSALEQGASFGGFGYLVSSNVRHGRRVYFTSDNGYPCGATLEGAAERACAVFGSSVMGARFGGAK